MTAFYPLQPVSHPPAEKPESVRQITFDTWLLISIAYSCIDFVLCSQTKYEERDLVLTSRLRPQADRCPKQKISTALQGVMHKVGQPRLSRRSTAGAAVSFHTTSIIFRQCRIFVTSFGMKAVCPTNLPDKGRGVSGCCYSS